MGKKAYCFDDPKHVHATRFAEEGDSSERDLEFLHQREAESKQRKGKNDVDKKTVKPKRKPRPVKTKDDVTSQWQKLCALKDSSSNARDPSKGSNSKSVKTRLANTETIAAIKVNTPNARRTVRSLGKEGSRMYHPVRSAQTVNQNVA